MVMNTGFSGGSNSKESASNAGDMGLIPGLGRFPGEGNGYQLQFSCLENSMDRGALWAPVLIIMIFETSATTVMRYKSI